MYYYSTACMGARPPRPISKHSVIDVTAIENRSCWSPSLQASRRRAVVKASPEKKKKKRNAQQPDKATKVSIDDDQVLRSTDLAIGKLTQAMHPSYPSPPPPPVPAEPQQHTAARTDVRMAASDGHAACMAPLAGSSHPVRRTCVAVVRSLGAI